MRALMDKALYDQFDALRAVMRERGVSNIAKVFVPVAPLTSDDSTPRVLFVGRATRDYGEADPKVADYEKATARDADLVRDQSSNFWAFNRQIMKSVFENLGLSWDGRLDAVGGYSNLAKIGDTKGNPTPLSLSVQSDLCRRSFEIEIGSMRPHAVVVMGETWNDSPFGRELIEDSFGRDGWDEVHPEGADELFKMKLEPRSRMLVVRAFHPERKKGFPAYAAEVGKRIAQSL